MKRVFMAGLVAGCNMVVFAQSTITTTTTAPANTATTVNAWAPGTSPYWGWNSYGIWDPSVATGVASPANANTTTVETDFSAGTKENLISSNSYKAYSPTVTALPTNVQMSFARDFPAATGNAYAWNKYGEWFQTYHMNNGRLIQYYYTPNGAGYALALPVLHTYVPETIVDQALQKYGASLYGITMLKTADGKDAYSVNLLQRGFINTEVLHEDGSVATNVWRTPEPVTAENLTATDANAAMDVQSIPSIADGETKTKWKENGVKTKVKISDGILKVKQKKVDD